MKTILKIREQKEPEPPCRVVEIGLEQMSGSVVIAAYVNDLFFAHLAYIGPDGIDLLGGIRQRFGLPLDAAGRLKLVGAPSVSTSLEMLDLLKNIAKDWTVGTHHTALITKAQAEIDGKDGSDG